MKNATIVARLWALCSSRSGRISNIRFSCLRLLFCCLWLCVGLLLAGSPLQAETKAGDILVVDAIGGTNGSGALFLVNPGTGQRTLLSDFGDAAQGPLGSGVLTGVAVGRAGQIFVTDLFAGGPSFGGALFGVDPDTGNRTVLSNFGQGDIQGPLYFGLAVNAKGKVIANLDHSTADQFKFALVRIDPRTDKRVLISDLTNPAQGDTAQFRFITDLAIERSGKILIGTDDGSSEEPDARIFRVHPVTGKRKLLSDFTNPAQGTDVGDLHFSTGLAVEASRRILVASGGSVVAPRNLLFRIHPKTGQRTVLSDFDNPAQGTLGVNLRGVAVEESGEIIVGAGDAIAPFTESQSLFRVDPVTGQRTLLSDSDNPVQGPSFSAVVYIAVVSNDSDAEDHD